MHGMVFTCRDEIRDLTTTKQGKWLSTLQESDDSNCPMCVSCTEMVKNLKAVQLPQHKANTIGFPFLALLILVRAQSANLLCLQGLFWARHWHGTALY